MRSRRLLFIVLALGTLGAAQEILPTAASATFPQCGLQCSILVQAEQACGATANGAIDLSVENCFCQYSTVQQIYASQDTTCAAECTNPGDRQLVRNWFTSFCNQVGQGINPLATTAATQTATNPGPTGSPKPHIISDPTDSDKTRQLTGSAWFSRYWKWIVMVIVLFFGLLAIGLLATWYKKRHQRKSMAKNKRTSNRLSTLLKAPNEKQDPPSPQPDNGQADLWGPHQHMAASKGYQYDAEHYGEAGQPQTTVRSNLSSRQSNRRHSRVDRSSKIDYSEMIDEIDERPQYPVRAASRTTRPRPEEMDVDLREAERRRAHEGRPRNGHTGPIGLAN